VSVDISRDRALSEHGHRAVLRSEGHPEVLRHSGPAV